MTTSLGAVAAGGSGQAVVGTLGDARPIVVYMTSPPSGDGAPEFFDNQLPDDYDAEVAVANAVGAKRYKPNDPEFLELVADGNDTIKWVVDDNGQLWVSPKYVGNQELKHGWLAGGGRVRAAGEAELATVGDSLFERNKGTFYFRQ